LTGDSRPSQKSSSETSLRLITPKQYNNEFGIEKLKPLDLSRLDKMHSLAFLIESKVILTWFRPTGLMVSKP